MLVKRSEQSAIGPAIAFFLLLSCICVRSFAIPANCYSLESNTISAPGCYYLNKNIKGSIEIDSDSVILDLNEKRLIDPKPGAQNIGIKLSSHSNITIKNGFLDGFWFAISGSGGKNLNKALEAPPLLNNDGGFF